MGSSRAHTFSLAFLAIGILVLGFFSGFLASGLLSAKRNKHPYARVSAGGVMAKRMFAINDAVKKGEYEYKFEVSGSRPILK